MGASPVVLDHVGDGRLFGLGRALAAAECVQEVQPAELDRRENQVPELADLPVATFALDGFAEPGELFAAEVGSGSKCQLDRQLGVGAQEAQSAEFTFGLHRGAFAGPKREVQRRRLFDRLPPVLQDPRQDRLRIPIEPRDLIGQPKC
jgi:hypothetical protein